MIELKRDYNVSNSMGLNVVKVNLQPFEQNFWDSIGEVNSDLDWLLGNLDLCFGWGPLSGELGSSASGFVSDWVGMKDSDTKFDPSG